MLCMQVSSYLSNLLSQARRVPPFIFEGPLCPAKEYFLMLCIFLLCFILLIFLVSASSMTILRHRLVFCDLDCQVV